MIIHNLERICTTWSCSRYKRKVTKFLVLRFPFSRPRLLPFIFPRITEPYILKELRTSGSHLWIQPVRKWTLSEVVRLLDGTSNDRMEESPMRKNVLRGVITPVDVIHGCETSFSMVHESNARWNHAETEGEQLLAYANAFLICVHSDDIYLKYRVEHFTKRLGNVGSHVSYFPSTSNIEWLLTWLRAACRAFNRERERERKKTLPKKRIKKKKKKIKKRMEKKYAEKVDPFAMRKNLCVATECINDEPATSRPERARRERSGQNIFVSSYYNQLCSLLLPSNGWEYE